MPINITSTLTADTAPALSNFTQSSTSSTITLGVDVDGAGDVLFAINTSSTPLTPSEIASAPAPNGVTTASGAGTVNLGTVTGLTASTTYYIHRTSRSSGGTLSATADTRSIATQAAGAETFSLRARNLTTDTTSSTLTINQGDSLQFTPTALSGWDLTPDTDTDNYMPQVHDIAWFLDTQRSGNYTYSDRTLTEHKSRQYLTGYNPQVCFAEAGTFVVTMTGYEVASGKEASQSITITVTSADTAYPTTQTIAINPNGDSDFSWAPSGAQQYQLSSGDDFDETELAWSENTGGLAKRFMFKPGVTFGGFNLNAGNSDWTSPIMFDGGDSDFSSSTLDIQDTSATVSIRVMNFNFTGTYDAVANTGGPAEFYGDGGNTDLVFHNVSWDAYSRILDIRPVITDPLYFHLNECSAGGDLGGQYPFLFAPTTNENSIAGVTGCRIYRKPESNDITDLRAIIRFNDMTWTYVQGGDFYQNTGSGQSTIKLGESGVPGGVMTLVQNKFERRGGFNLRFMTGGAGSETTNLVYRQNVIVIAGGPDSGRVDDLHIGNSGTSIDSNLFVTTGTAGNLVQRNSAGVIYNMSNSSVSPNKIRSNTYVHYKDATENGSSADPVLFAGSNGNAVDGSNVEYNIGFSDLFIDGVAQTFADANMDQATSMFLARTTGARFSGGSFNTDYAADPSNIYTFQQQSGSELIGAGASTIWPFPIDAQTVADLRPSGSEDAGCWQGVA